MAQPPRFLAQVDLQATPTPDAYVFGFHEGRLVVAVMDTAASAPTFAQLETVLGSDAPAIYLGRFGDRPCFAFLLAAQPELPPEFGLAGLRELFGRLQPELHSVAGRAFQTVEWYRNHAFCGRCGSPTSLVAQERARACHSCGAVYFPRINPAVIMLVERGSRMLLARNHNFRGPFFSALAGFVEPGESLEEAVEREVFEEVGIELEGIRYFESQPWPFPSQLMIGFTARHRAGEIRLQDSEILEARWFEARGELPQLPGPFSLARRLIESFLKRQQAGAAAGS